MENLVRAKKLWNPAVEAWLPRASGIYPSVVLINVTGHTGGDV